MRTKRRSTLVVALAVVSTVVTTTLAGATPGLASSGNLKITTVISGLNAPRGVVFDGRGSLYVSESGLAGTGPAGLTHTGRVSKFPRGSTHPAWSTHFESLFVTEDPSQPPDVLGPEGLSALADSCRHSSGTSCQVRLIMSESHDGAAAVSGGAIQSTQLGHLFRLNARTGVPTDLSDVGDQMFTWTGDRKELFPSDFPDSNPYGVLVVKDRRHHGKVRTFVADAGANTISEVMRNGVLRVIAYIPNETAAPFRDATPTCIAQGPDGMLYVATLHLLANFASPGQSDVWRVDPNANYPTAPTVWAHGLTTPTACTFDHNGNFWATEMFQPNASGPPGDLVRIPFRHPTRLDRIGGGRLPLPGGITQGPDGAMYVSINSASPVPGSGAIVRVRTHSRHHD